MARAETKIRGIMAKSRKSPRQRKRAQRATTRPAPPRSAASDAGIPSPVQEPDGAVASVPAPSSGTAPARSSVAGGAPRGARANPRLTVAGPSRLSERAIEEYHYVGRDLRNIARLVVVMAVLLAVAFIAFSALGLGTTA